MVFAQLKEWLKCHKNNIVMQDIMILKTVNFLSAKYISVFPVDFGVKYIFFAQLK